ncbi:hypothetical protein ACWNX2_00810 [Candidatus Vidania fulgoroideorum]
MRHQKHKKYSKKTLKIIPQQIKELLQKTTITTTYKTAKLLIKQIRNNKNSTTTPQKITINTLKYRRQDQCKIVTIKLIK